MATTPRVHPSVAQSGPLFGLNADRRHWLRLRLTWLLAIAVIVIVAFYGTPYYRLDLPGRAYSPMHRTFRPSGSAGLRLGFLGLAMFLCLFLYPIRKQWGWLAQFGKTKNWLDFHVLLGITAPIIITLHSSFKLSGLAGVAYWIMVAVAVSGFVGRYLYAQVPRQLSTAEMSLKEMEEELSRSALALTRQDVLQPGDMEPLLKLPSRQEVDHMPVTQAIWTMFLMDVARPVQVSRLRRRFLTTGGLLRTLGGLLPSSNRDLEGVINAIRRQSWMSTKMLFLARVHQLFHLWHVVHRPFSYSFAALVVVHVAVVMMLGYF